jgi:hypothetical protein
MFRPNLKIASLPIIATMVVSAFMTTDANAVLTNRYSFTTNADDSVGTAHGVIVGTNGSVAGNQLVLANTGQGSENPGTDGAFLDLPNGLISSAAAPSGVVTVEMWITMSANRDWAAAFTAGISVGGEGAAMCCNDDQPYIQIIPRTGDGGQGNDVRVTTNTFGGGEGFVDDAGAGNGTDLQIGRKEHLVSVFDQSGGLPGNVTVYRNGALMGTAPIAANLDLKKFARNGDLPTDPPRDVNIWLGRSQWGDSLAAASYDELRIYSNAVSAQQALVNTVYGPDVTNATAIPSIEVNKTTGEITFKNNSNASVNLEYYSITSAAGGLKTNTWTSIGAGWDKAGGSNANQLIELFLGAAGSPLAPNAALTLGTPYNAATFGGLDGDLVFKFGVNNGPLVTAPVTYIGSTPSVSGDYNNNGVVDAADYILWRNGGPLQNDPTAGVQATDFDFWRSRFGANSGSGSGSAVPEPAALALVGLSFVLAGAVRRKK